MVTLNLHQPDIRLALIGKPEPDDMGMGTTKELVYYGSFEDLQNEHTITSKVMDFLHREGMGRWSINRISAPRPLGSDDMEHLPEDRKNETHKVSVIVMDPGI